ncbi:MAG: RNA polymerase sigma factor [Planctomycetota bacterium]|jgi:RNA polymerase sigma-70 factor (ECF subfamily)
MDLDTSIGRGPGVFPSTCWSRIVGGEAADPDWNALAQRYWRPVYGYLRRRWRQSNEDAKDAAQAFFVWMIESGLMAKADPGRGRFRGFVKTSLQNYMVDEARRQKALKRGGGSEIRSMQFDDSELLPEISSAEAASPEDVLDAAWRRELVNATLQRLEEEFNQQGQDKYFAVFREYFLSDDSSIDYRQLADRHGINTTQVSNYLRKAKQRYRALLRVSVKETVRSEDDLREELEWLFGPGQE